MDMVERVKLLTLWLGKLPEWYSKFQERMAANNLVVHQLLSISSVEGLNTLASSRLGSPCRKATPYAIGCDLRPMLGKVYDLDFGSYEWWGWCDLDIVVGDLDRLLGPLLDQYDIISTDGRCIHGPMTLLRNTEDVVNLYQKGPWREVLANPDYCNFDEAGFRSDDQIRDKVSNGNPNFTDLVNQSGLRVHYDDRSWAENKEPLDDGIPLRCCELRDDQLLEIPTGRELLLYHFTSKQWPLPNRYERFHRKQQERIKERSRNQPEPPQEYSPSFWDRRVKEVESSLNPIHYCVNNVETSRWVEIQRHTAEVLRGLLTDGSDKVLDAGCGYGAALECVRDSTYWTGLDFSPEMVRLAKWYFPTEDFTLGNLNAIPFPDDAFDWVLCRGIEGWIKTVAGLKEWDRILKEMLRVAPRLILINHACEYRTVER